MDKKGHLGDKALVDIQNLLSTTLVPLSKLVDFHKKSKTMTKEVKGLFSDVITGLGQVQYSISLRRRYHIRPYLKKKYSPLCNMTMPITTKLFGDDISKEVKSCDNISFLGKDPYYQSNFRGAIRSRGRFRGRRGYGNLGFVPQGFNGPQYGGYQGQGYRQQPYPTRGFSVRGAGQYGGRTRAPRRRPTATVTSASLSRDPNEEE
ncbi:uncharacterized protein LOC123540161 [Mercenaria mercenaria]|uniref:uncharacterized protein LOC123540161 n=1 Tax=Mercenaria mercenaria TaxID=6596 RepID=UPI00234F9307|nr:uncharacterized protein LOC123540161 [Mercenaria mercenaria]